MNLARTSILNALSAAIKLGTSLLLNKVLAVYVGPAGYAVIGQFQSISAMVATFASGAIGTGVTKYTAQYRDEPERQEAVWRTAVTLGLFGAALFSALLLVLKRPIAAWALGDASLHTVVAWLACALGLLVLNGLMLAILNGRKAVRSYVAANIAGSLVGAAAAVLLVLRWRLYGALVAVVVSQAVAAVGTAWLFHRAVPVRWGALVGRIDRAVARRLGAFALMSATSAIAVPLAHIAIREGLGDRLGWQAAGLWQALWRISETHLLLLTSTLAVYFLPRFAEISDPRELRDELRQGYRFVLPLVLVSAGAIFLVRRPLIRLLLTPAFLPLSDALGWQLAGDVLKVGSWVTAYTMVSHGMTRAFVVTEVVFAALLAGSIVVLGGLWGLRGAAMGYALTYAVYWVVVRAIFRRLLLKLEAAGAVAEPEPDVAEATGATPIEVT